MPVIAMNQEMGSHGRLVAEGVAAVLGLTIVRHEVIDHIAKKMHTRKSTIQRFLEGKAGVLERWGTDESSLALYKAEEVLELAAKGNVLIRGWGATALLRPISHVLCVRVSAPTRLRAKWLMERLDTDDEELALREIQLSDDAHATNMQHHFGVRWGDPMLYDLVLNTERVSVASCVEAIRLMVDRPEFEESPESLARLENLALEYRARAALRTGTKTADVNVTIDVDEGHVTLAGIVISDEERRATGEVVAHVAGVKKITNKLRVMKDVKIFPSSKT